MKAKRLSDRQFGLMFSLVFALVAIVVWFVNGSYQYWAAVVAAAFLLLSLVRPVLLLPLNRLWMQLGHGIGLVSNTVLLGAFYFLIVMPFGWGIRFLSEDPMQRRARREADSYFVPVRRHANPKTFPDMF